MASLRRLMRNPAQVQSFPTLQELGPMLLNPRTLLVLLTPTPYEELEERKSSVHTIS